MPDSSPDPEILVYHVQIVGSDALVPVAFRPAPGYTLLDTRLIFDGAPAFFDVMMTSRLAHLRLANVSWHVVDREETTVEAARAMYPGLIIPPPSDWHVDANIWGG